MKNLYELDKGVYTGIHLKNPVRKVSEMEVERQIQQILESNATNEPKDGPAAWGDTAVIDYEGFKDGVAFPGGKGTQFPLGLGSRTFIPGFESQLVGHAAGEDVDVKLSFPVNYQEKSLAGQPVVFKVHIHQIVQKKRPQFDDAFAKSKGEESAEKFREAIKEQIQNYYNGQAVQNMNNELVKAACINGHLVPTEEMKDEATKEVIEEFKVRLALGKKTMEQFLAHNHMTEKDFENHIRAQAESGAHIRALLGTIAKQEGIWPDEAAVEAFYEGVAKGNHRTVEEIKEIFPYYLAEYNVTMERATRFMRDHAVVEEKA